MKKVYPEGLFTITIAVCDVPSGLIKYTYAKGFVTLVTKTAIRFPAIALKLSRASCPTVVVVAVTGDPSIAMVDAKSGVREMVIFPDAVEGSIPMV
jgi:hypothetical protein